MAERVVVTVRGTATEAFENNSATISAVAQEVGEALKNHGIVVDDSNFFTLQLHSTTQL